jgi:phosphohistidine phosphatase
MKTLYLVRHAHAGWHNAALADFERTLSDRGRMEAAEMAGRFAETEGVPGLIVSSPACRALETAETFAERLGYPHDAIRLEAGVYSADVGTYGRIVRDLPAGTGSVMLFGHNPVISLYGAWLCGKAREQMDTCGMVRLELDAESWEGAERGSAREAWYRRPEGRQ